MIKIETHQGVKTYDHLINPKYIVSIGELYNGQTEIILENGANYIVSESIYEIRKKIEADKE